MGAPVKNELIVHIRLGWLDGLAAVQWATATALMSYEAVDDELGVLAAWSLLIAIWASVTTLLAWHSRNMADLQRAFTLGVERGIADSNLRRVDR